MKKIFFQFNTGIIISLIAAVVLVAAGFWLFNGILSLEKPVIKLAGTVERVGLSKNVDVTLSDRKTGLRSIAIWIEQGGNKFPIFTADIPKGTKEKTVNAVINARDLKLQDGEAVLFISAQDYSVWKNRATAELRIIVDTLPLQIFPLTSAHNINAGGTCLTLFRLSKEPEKAGVMVGQDFFPGYMISLNGKNCFLTYFPIPGDLSKLNKMGIYAEDKAGNQSFSSLPYFIRQTKKFRADTVDLSDRFLQNITPQFQIAEPSLRGKTAIEVFTYVNSTLREINENKIREICGKSSQNGQLWQGTFLRMKNGAPMALFGDERTYTHQRQAVGNSVHLGVDLASTAHSPVEAANNGVVTFAGNLGIYGNAVIIDHGVGIFSLYGHLESINVKESQKVAKGDAIGITGQTGLAGGDHLHFSILCGGRFVNPVEWWDPHWIQDNVDKKLKEALQLL